MRPLSSPKAIRAALVLLLFLPALNSFAQKPKPPRDGVYQIFHPTAGYLIVEQHYKNGERHGPSRQYEQFGLSMEEYYTEGKLDGFQRRYHQGHLVSEKFYKDGKPEGFTFVRNDDYKMSGQYLNGKPDGVWTAESVGHWRLVKNYKDGLPHGLWERKSADGKRVLRLTYENGKLLCKGDELRNLPYLQKVSGLAASGKDPLAEAALKFLEHDVDLEYPETPLSEVIEDLSARFNVPIYMDHYIRDVPRVMKSPITINEKQVPVFLGLHDLVVDHGLTFDYRFHSFWLTTRKGLAAWNDPTGVSDLKPAAGSSLAKALPEPPKFDFLATPLSQLSEALRTKHDVEFDVSSVPAIKWKSYDPNLKLSLRDDLFIILYQNNCRCREQDGKLIIEPLETKP